MFSEVQREYIKNLVDTYHDEYPYYLAYTNTYIGSGYGSDDDNFYIVFSDEPIQANSRYSYSLSGNRVAFGVRSGNASYNYHSERVHTITAPSSVSINNYEWVYTNAEFTGVQLQPDVTATRAVTTDIYQGVSIALLVVLLSVVFFRLIRR